jgi:hypothetical protein
MNDHQNGVADDVRMRGVARRHTVEAALAWLDAQLLSKGAPPARRSPPRGAIRQRDGQP